MAGATSRWSTVGASPGCDVTAPAVGSACSAPGVRCDYIVGPPGLVSTYLSSFCCDGESCAWTHQASDQGCPNGNTCGTIDPADYDQSCTADSDCVAEPAGDFCVRGRCTNCQGGAVNIKDQARYEADLASKISVQSLCPCANAGAPTCVLGKCTFSVLVSP
jgi:hypothetical protein